MRRAARIVLGYALWFISSALALWGGLWLRVVLVVDVPIGRVSYWSLRLWNYLGTVFVGIAWLIFVLATEGWFRKTPEEALPVMLIRAAKIFAVEMVFLGVVYGVHLLI